MSDSNRSSAPAADAGQGAGAIDRLAISNEGFVFDPITGNSYVTNPVALRILQGLRAGQDDEAILAALLEEFEVDVTEARGDLEGFRTRLVQFGLGTEVTP